MKYSNEEKTSSGELAIEYLESAIDELTGIPEYKNICEDLKEKYRELQTKYNNVERELLRRDKQYKELLERVNKND